MKRPRSFLSGFDAVRPEMDGFEADFLRFGELAKAGERAFRLDWRDRIPRLDDWTSSRGYEPHYTYHPAWAARVLARSRPSLHTDVSSSLSFVTLVSAFVKTEFFDIRPAALELDNLKCRRADLTQLPFASGSVESLSCMHVVEHVGLGRYGDPLDPEGDLKAIAELTRVLAPGGSLLLVVPVGRTKLHFNAHRIYSYEQICSCFSELRVVEFALVDDRGDFQAVAESNRVRDQDWGCGCWWFCK